MKILSSMLMVAALALVGCGENAKKDDAKKDTTPPAAVTLDGVWQTKCKDGVQKTVEIRGEKYTYKALTYEKKDCTGKSKETGSLQAKITHAKSDAKGFTHRASFEEEEGAVYDLGVSVGANDLKFEGESDVYVRIKK